MPYNLVNSALLKVMSTLFITTNYLSNPKICQRAQRKFTFNLPSAAISYAKILPTSAKKVYFLIAECSYILCKDSKSKFLYQNISKKIKGWHAQKAANLIINITQWYGQITISILFFFVLHLCFMFSDEGLLQFVRYKFVT